MTQREVMTKKNYVGHNITETLKTKHFLIFVTTLLLSLSIKVNAQGMTLHMGNGDKLMLKTTDTDSITFTTDNRFTTQYPKDTVFVEQKKDTIFITQPNDTIYIQQVKDSIIIERDTIEIHHHTDTIYVLRSDGSVIKPYHSVKATPGSQYDMAAWSIPAGNYSGIAWLGNNRYAIISDKQQKDGWQEVTIDIDSTTGDIKKMHYIAQHFPSGTAGSARDAEGIALFPSSNTLFVSAESDQRIIELDMEGRTTGRQLSVPAEMGTASIYGNYGFESLTYSPTTHRFYTTTENTLRTDGTASGYSNLSPAPLRIISFTDDMQPDAQYAYITDAPTVSATPRLYAFGVPALTALADGSLLVMEREFYVANSYLGSYVTNKIYRTQPLRATSISFHDNINTLPDTIPLQKTLLTQFTTYLTLGRMNIANYEGMCLGPTLDDGRQTLLLISDSQDNYGNFLYHLKDYIRIIVLDIEG